MHICIRCYNQKTFSGQGKKNIGRLRVYNLFRRTTAKKNKALMFFISVDQTNIIYKFDSLRN